MIGFLNLNKPSGWTSHDCVAKVRRLLNTKKVGHGGTLDPAAMGVLPIAIGKATRLLQFLPEAKVYRAKFRFGVTTTTDDLEGEITNTNPASHINLENIRPLINNFIGKIEQIPPNYSAIKQQGQKLYKLARAGKEINVNPRIVEINNIEIIDWYPGDFPELEVRISCGKGTYIRAIARDLGQVLQVGGTLSSLIREESCNLKLENSLTLEQVEQQVREKRIILIEPDQPLSQLFSISLSTENSNNWCQGKKLLLSSPEINRELPLASRVYNNEEKFLGIGIISQEEEHYLLAPKIVLILPN